MDNCDNEHSTLDNFSTSLKDIMAMFPTLTKTYMVALSFMLSEKLQICISYTGLGAHDISDGVGVF